MSSCDILLALVTVAVGTVAIWAVMAILYYAGYGIAASQQAKREREKK